MQKIRLFEMFAGYGGASFALKKAGIDFEIVGYSEIDKFAIQCYEQNHCKNNNKSLQNNEILQCKNYGDATKINPKELPDFDLLTGGFPCQSFSVAGKMQGVCDSRGTLFWDIWRIAKEKQPKYMLLENVKGLTTKRFKDTFEKILKDLDEIGYDVNWKVLNSKDYGIPQNRERVWFVCIRKDLKQEFEFPEPTGLKIFLKDILEDEVDEKYYLKESQVKNLLRDFGSKGQDLTDKKVSNTPTTAMGSGGGNVPYIQQINKPKHSNDRVYDPKGISPTLNSMQGGNRQPFIISSTQKHSSKNNSGISPTLTSAMGAGGGHVPMKVENETRIRKLTPKECFRLMGFLNDEINLERLSNTQKYKLAGNGWEINVVSKIFKNLLT